MMAFLIAAVMILWVIAIIYTGIMAMESRIWWIRWACAAMCFGLMVAAVGAALNMAAQQTATGPCLRYETGMHYNPATKTTMPYRRCAERGEWITEDME